MIKGKSPKPYAYCWYKGKELSKRQIEAKGCLDPVKQCNKRLCKWLQMYGPEDREYRRLDLLECYRDMRAMMRAHGATLDGQSLVQELPGGGRLRLWFDEADKYWREREGGSD